MKWLEAWKPDLGDRFMTVRYEDLAENPVDTIEAIANWADIPIPTSLFVEPDRAHIDWSNQHRLAFEYDTGEVDDGVDNDGDGLADEGNLVLRRNDGLANEVRIVLCRGVAELFEGELANGIDDNGNGVVDEAGFNVHRVGDVLTIRLTVQDALGQGVILTRSLETSSRLRN